MGYDISIGNWSGNHTSNSLGDLVWTHLCVEKGMRALDGKTGKQASQILQQFWCRVRLEKQKFWRDGVVGAPEMCAKYDSPNGWGSLVGALIFMGELTAACAENPRHKIKVSA
jgi:hypothetical protein